MQAIWYACERSRWSSFPDHCVTTDDRNGCVPSVDGDWKVESGDDVYRPTPAKLHEYSIHITRSRLACFEQPLLSAN